MKFIFVILTCTVIIDEKLIQIHRFTQENQKKKKIEQNEKKNH